MSKKFFSLLSTLLFSFSSFGVTVDKMIIIPNGSEKKTEIKVVNPDKYPVFLRVTLSELENDNEVVELKEEQFEDWPVYLERSEYIMGPEEEVTIPIQLLARQIGKKQEEDRILAIDIMPESVVNGDGQGQTMNILLGFRVWVILSKDGDVIGKPSIVLTDDGYVLKNNSNTVALFDIDLCKTTFNKNKECKGSEFVLSGKDKKLNLSDFTNGKASVSMRDPHSRYIIEDSVKL
ncbi:hypothetical protein FB440_104114 [Vibrio crassostreae]|uniref:hypothetical protein n=1 Tax=Vibrio crassostreae TaxID=246167 RepID=UPI00119A8CF5|nr:hypothetical protein [Vibrio crassostreae]TWD40951.1 hypothetical protein FB440_104114 [Vibrio crassostreae]